MLFNQRKDTFTRRANSSFSRMMVCVTFVMTTWKIMMLHWHNQGFSWQFSISFKLLGSVLCGGLLSSNVSDCSLLGYRQSYREDCELRLEWQHRILISILFTTQYTTKLITINWTKNMSRNLNFNYQQDKSSLSFGSSSIYKCVKHWRCKINMELDIKSICFKWEEDRPKLKGLAPRVWNKFLFVFTVANLV